MDENCTFSENECAYSYIQYRPNLCEKSLGFLICCVMSEDELLDVVVCKSLKQALCLNDFFYHLYS